MRWLSITLLSLLACDEPVRAPFVVEGLTVAEGPLALDEPIGLRFSEPLAARAPARAVRIFTQAGTVVPIVRRVTGRHLWLHSAHPSGLWPRGERLELRLVHPAPGLPLTSRSNRRPRRGFQASLQVSDKPSARPLRLVHCDLSRNPVSGELEYPQDDEPRAIEMTFDGPVATDSLGTGLQLIALSRREGAQVEFRRDPLDWRRVRVLPHNESGQEVFSPGERFQFRITRHLRSTDGRRAAGGQRVEFDAPSSSENRARTLSIEFSDARDLVAGSPARGHFQNGVLRPRPLTSVALATTQADSALTTLHTPDGLIHTPFGREPARLQLLIPPHVLGTEPCLLQRLALSTAAPIPDGTEILDFELTISLVGARTEQLADQFQTNRASATTPRRIGLPENVRSLLVGRDDGFSDKDVPALVIPFGVPFAYEGDGRGLLIEITHGGVRPPPDIASRPNGPEFERSGIRLLGSVADGASGAPTCLVIGEPRARQGRALAFLPAFALETQRFPTIISKWHVVEGGATPEFFLKGRDLSLDGLERSDLDLQFQGGTPTFDEQGQPRRDGEGRVICVPIGDPDRWSPYPPQGGARAIRVKIHLDPRVAVRNERGLGPEIAYVFVRYHER